MKICCIVGEEDIPQPCRGRAKAMLKSEVVLAVENGYRVFACRLQFPADRLSLEIAGELRGEYGSGRLFVEGVVDRNLCERYEHGLLAACNGIRPLRRPLDMLGDCGRVLGLYPMFSLSGTLDQIVLHCQAFGRELRLIRY